MYWLNLSSTMMLPAHHLYPEFSWAHPELNDLKTLPLNLSQTFELPFDGIIGRITPTDSKSAANYVLDFIWPDGIRLKETHNFRVWVTASHGSSRFVLPPSGKNFKVGEDVQIYQIDDSRDYEVCDIWGSVIKTISFQRSVCPPLALKEIV
jgi:hypothetical protein